MPTIRNPQHVYTISINAATQLYTTLAPTTQSSSTQYRKQQTPQYDGFTVYTQSIQDPSAAPKLEGIAHALNLISQHYLITEWLDTRTRTVREQHDAQLQLPPQLEKTNTSTNTNKSYLKQSREYHATHSRPQYEAKWYEEYLQSEVNSWEDEEEEWDELPQWDQDYRTQMQGRKTRKINLSLHPTTQQYLYDLARFYKMAPRHQRRSKTAFVSAALEAIGLHYLTPPQGYQTLIDTTPNPQKVLAQTQVHIVNPRAPRRKRAKGGGTYGNHEHTPWMYRPIEEMFPKPQPHELPDHPDYVYTLQDYTYYAFMTTKYAPPNIGNLDPSLYNSFVNHLTRATLQLQQQGLLPPLCDEPAEPATSAYLMEGPQFVPAVPPATSDNNAADARHTPARKSYYATLRKLTPEQIAEAYTLYTLVPQQTRTNPPSIHKLAQRYNVSDNTMFRALHNYKFSLSQQPSTTTPAQHQQLRRTTNASD